MCSDKDRRQTCWRNSSLSYLSVYPYYIIRRSINTSQFAIVVTDVNFVFIILINIIIIVDCVVSTELFMKKKKKKKKCH